MLSETKSRLSADKAGYAGKRKIAIGYTIVLLLILIASFTFGQSKTKVYFQGDDIYIKGDTPVNAVSLIIQDPGGVVINILPNPELPFVQSFFAGITIQNRDKDKIFIGWFSFWKGIDASKGYKFCTLYTAVPELKFIKSASGLESELSDVNGQPLDVEFINR